ncbi:TVP38/TMEM64 family protein [Parvularcula dongshanensis]|uniref:TVP38/TMEM64 family membrane protein n=1 Tax=Parvularcula dongshanensis TaxID=1173995 RepID=A0A840I5H8_9PROT|nr:VTT domain-containing protein [Parvularcula dongshanensis]MBB4659531.1 putative membrane protein YdjX (TVP38/TMEM64 family) [Parvularcula dongshanensis]
MTLPPARLTGRLGRFVNNMDRKAATSAAVTLGLLTVITVLPFFGVELLGLDEAQVRTAFARIAESPLALPGVVVVYCVLAFTGFPQAILIAGTVAVFGVERGIAYSWIATMVSGGITFALGRLFGERALGRLSAGRAASMIAVMRRHGLLASAAVRVMPSAPFIVVNAACGAARIPTWKYALGTGIGILPKILFLSLFTGQIDELMGFLAGRRGHDVALLLAITAGWIGFLLLARWLYMRLKRGTLSGLSE